MDDSITSTEARGDETVFAKSLNSFLVLLLLTRYHIYIHFLSFNIGNCCLGYDMFLSGFWLEASRCVVTDIMLALHMGLSLLGI